MGTIPGPTLECNVGDRIIVHFRNKDFRPGLDITACTHSLHPHGVVFAPQYDGAFPLSAEGDKVLTRFTWRGTHRGEFAGIPPTGERVEVWTMALDRISDGKLVESHLLMDNVGMLQQMGVMPPPEQSEEASPT
jgi:hypothetical protein